MKLKFFKTQGDFRKWLEKNHLKKDELLVGFWRKRTGKQCMTWEQSVDEVLCFGWIDGIRKSVDDKSYMQRYTPRRARSIWSNINIRKVEELKKKGLMFPAGLEAYGKRDEKRSGVYSAEQKEIKLSDEFEKKFKKNKKAWEFFNLQPPSYRRPAIHLTMSAKKEETRIARLQRLIDDSEKGLRIKELRPLRQVKS